MEEYGVIFMHHNASPITVDNYRRAQELNPGAPFVALSCGKTSLPGGILLRDLNCYERRWQKATNDGDPVLAWANPDLAIFQWYSQNKTVKCKRWCLMEWDTKCCMSWPEFWKSVWNEPAAAIKVFEPRDLKKWRWFELVNQLPLARRNDALGIYLFGALMLSDSALRLCTSMLDNEYFDSFSELRLGTLLNSVFKKPVAHPSPVGLIDHDADVLLQHDTDKPGIWHPVKNLPVHFTDPVRGPTVLRGVQVIAKRMDGTIIERPRLHDD